MRGKKRRISQDSSRASKQSAAQQTTTDGEIKQMSVTDQQTHTQHTWISFLDSLQEKKVECKTKPTAKMLVGFQPHLVPDWSCRSRVGHEHRGGGSRCSERSSSPCSSPLSGAWLSSNPGLHSLRQRQVKLIWFCPQRLSRKEENLRPGWKKWAAAVQWTADRDGLKPLILCAAVRCHCQSAPQTLAGC